MFGDPTLFVAQHHDDLIREAAQARLADQLERGTSSLRHVLALGCLRLADVLDSSNQRTATSSLSPWERLNPGVRQSS
jgi:hypothetical protein